MISVLIVDDEANGRQYLSKLISQDDRFNIVGQCSNGIQAIHAFKRQKPDVIFLDIRMGGLSGFDVCKSIGKTETKIVFVTAYGQHALEAFDFEPVDYITKPIRTDRFKRTLDRLYRNIGQKNSALSTSEIRKIQLSTVDGQLIFAPFQLQFLEGANNYVRVWIDNQRYLTRTTLQKLASRLDLEQLIQVHRCFFVNKNLITKIVKLPHGAVALKLKNCSKKIPISRSRKREVLNLIDDLTDC